MLEPLRGYLMLAEALVRDGPTFATGWNFGPADDDAMPVSWIADRLEQSWGGKASLGTGRRRPPAGGGGAAARHDEGSDIAGLASRRCRWPRRWTGSWSGTAGGPTGATSAGSRWTQIERYEQLLAPRSRPRERLTRRIRPVENIVVLGSGMGALGAAYHLHGEGLAPVLYDKNSYHGGHTASFQHPGGFLFDIGPHISFTKDDRIQELFAESVDHQFETIQIRLNNYWRGHWPVHPVQLHLHGLPEDVIIKVIADFVAADKAEEGPIRNYADWLLASFGRTFAELFPMQYTRKYHLTTAENMSTDWLGPRIYKPSLEEVLRGALSPGAPNIHYITHFRYPTRGGFAAYLRRFLPLGEIKLQARTGRAGSAGAGADLPQRHPDPVLERGLLDPAARPGADDRRDAARRAGGGSAPGLFHLRAGQRRGRS